MQDLDNSTSFVRPTAQSTQQQQPRQQTFPKPQSVPPQSFKRNQPGPPPSQNVSAFSQGNSMNRQHSNTSQRSSTSVPASLQSGFQQPKSINIPPPSTKPAQSQPKPQQMSQQSQIKPQASSTTQPENDDDDYDDEYDDYYDDEDIQDDSSITPNNSSSILQEQSIDDQLDADLLKSPQVLNILNMFKNNFPGAQKLCLHFVTDSCKFMKTCKLMHDEALKKQCLSMVKQSQKSIEQAIPKEAIKKFVEPEVAEVQQEAAPLKNPGIDLRNMLQGRGSNRPPATLEEEFQASQAPSTKTAIKKTLGQKKKPIQEEEVKTTPIVSQDDTPVSRSSLSNIFPKTKPFQSFESKTFEMPSQPPQLSKLQSTRTSKAIEIKRAQLLQDLQHIKMNAKQYIIPGKAHCLTMCPADQIIQRGQVEVSSVSAFEKDQNGNNFETLAIKTYNRSAADKVMNDPDTIRPPQVLQKVVQYLGECIGDLDRLQDETVPYFMDHKPTFSEVYSFFRDRAKCVTQDFGIIDKPDSEYLINALEELIRYLICATHDGFITEHFNMKQHIDIINANLTILIHSYDVIKFKYPNPEHPFRKRCLANEVEFQCYQIINFSNSSLVSADIINGLDITSFDGNTKLQDYLRTAIRINMSVSNQNLHAFFSTLKRTDNYMFACMMLQFLTNMRKRQLNTVIQGGMKNQDISIEEIKKVLMMESKQDAISFAKACGYQQTSDQHITRSCSISYDDQNDNMKNWLQHDNVQFLDRLRGTNSRFYFMQTPLLQCDLSSIGAYEMPIVKPQQTIVQPISKPLIPVVPKTVDISIIPVVQQPSKIIPPVEAPVIEPEKPSDQEIEENKKVELKKVLKEKEEKEEQERLLKIAAAEKLRQDAINREQAEKQRKLEEEAKRVQELQKLQELKKEQAIEKFKQMGMKLVVNRFMQFFKVYKPFLGKKRLVRTFSTKMEDQLEDDYLENALEAMHQPAMSRQVSQNYEKIQGKTDISYLDDKQEFSFVKLVQQVIPESKGELKIKLFSHKLNKEGSASWDILKCLTSEIFEESYPDTNTLGIKFKFQDFPESTSPQILMQSIIGNNLIVIFSSMKSLMGDIKKVKDALIKCPQYSQFSFLWIMHKTGEEKKLHINFTENTVLEALYDELRQEKVSNLKVTTVYSNSRAPTKSTKRQKTSKIDSNQISIKNAVLAFILDDLESTVKASKTYEIVKSKSKSIKIRYIQDALKLSLGELYPVLMLTDFQHLPKLINSITSIPTLKDIVQILENDSEVQVLNFFIFSMQQMLEPLYKSIKESIAKAVQQFKFQQFNLEVAQNLRSEVLKIKNILEIQPINWNNDLETPEGIKQFESLIAKTLDKLYRPQQIVTLQKEFGHHLIYDSYTPPAHQKCKNKNMTHYLAFYHGASFFNILLKPYFETFNEKAYFFESSDLNQSLSDFDLIEIRQYLFKVREQSQLQIRPQSKIMTNNHKLQLHQSVKHESRLKGGVSIGAMIGNEIKLAMNPMSLENKRREILAKESMEFAQRLHEFNENERERTQKILEEDSSLHSVKRQKLSNTSSTSIMVSSINNSASSLSNLNESAFDLSKHDAHMSELKSMLAKRPRTKLH